MFTKIAMAAIVATYTNAINLQAHAYGVNTLAERRYQDTQGLTGAPTVPTAPMTDGAPTKKNADVKAFLTKHSVAFKNLLNEFSDQVEMVKNQYPNRIKLFKKNPTKALRKILKINPNFFSDLVKEHAKDVYVFCNENDDN